MKVNKGLPTHSPWLQAMALLFLISRDKHCLRYADSDVSPVSGVVRQNGARDENPGAALLTSQLYHF